MQSGQAGPHRPAGTPLGLEVPEDRIYLDHGLTGTNRDRPGLAQALAAVRAGDTLVVPKLDRRARSVPDARDILARHLFHGRKGELHRAYRDGQEDQLGALGLVLNYVTSWNTVYRDRALTQLRVQGYPVLDEDMARLSAYIRRHINVHGHYAFRLPDLGGAWRPLRDPDQSDPDEQD